MVTAPVVLIVKAEKPPFTPSPRAVVPLVVDIYAVAEAVSVPIERPRLPIPNATIASPCEPLVTVTTPLAWIAAIVLAVFVVVLWLIVPFFLRSRRNRRGES